MRHWQILKTVSRLSSMADRVDQGHRYTRPWIHVRTAVQTSMMPLMLAATPQEQVTAGDRLLSSFDRARDPDVRFLHSSTAVFRLAPRSYDFLTEMAPAPETKNKAARALRNPSLATTCAHCATVPGQSSRTSHLTAGESLS